MLQYQAVPSSLAISRKIADLLEDFIPEEKFDRAKLVRGINDVLQGRSDMSLDMLVSILQERAAPERVQDVNAVLEKIEAFYRQKMMLGRCYTKAGCQAYQYKLWDLDPNHPLKIIDQSLFDHAAANGFPPDFFKESYFDEVTIYCMPDGADCSESYFQGCDFAVCGIRGAVFDKATLYDSEFHSSVLQMVNFTGTTIVSTHFRDSSLKSVSFQDARLKSCLTVDCSMDQIDFLNAELDGASYGRVNSHRILNLPSTTITQGGATTEEVTRLRFSIFRELNVSMFPVKHRPPANRRRKVSAPER